MPIDISQVLNNELTPDQRAAAVDPASDVLCLACAGSGKSRTLAYRIARILVAGESAEGIVAFTFTEKAAESIKRRASQALARVGIDPNVLGAMYIGTIHSYCQNILGRIDAVYRQFDVLDENRLKLYIISRYPQLALAPLRSRARGNSYFDAIKQLSDAWKTLNDEMLSVDQVAIHDQAVGQALTRLGDSLRRDQYIDFSLMIRIVVDDLISDDTSARTAVAGLRHLMVDEYQDVSPSQEELIRQLRRDAQSLFVVGDDDQSIYAWRGADVSNILTFHNRFPNSAQMTLSRKLQEHLRDCDGIRHVCRRRAWAEQDCEKSCCRRKSRPPGPRSPLVQCPCRRSPVDCKSNSNVARNRLRRTRWDCARLDSGRFRYPYAFN